MSFTGHLFILSAILTAWWIHFLPHCNPSSALCFTCCIFSTLVKTTFILCPQTKLSESRNCCFIISTLSRLLFYEYELHQNLIKCKFLNISYKSILIYAKGTNLEFSAVDKYSCIPCICENTHSQRSHVLDLFSSNCSFNFTPHKMGIMIYLLWLLTGLVGGSVN